MGLARGEARQGAPPPVPRLAGRRAPAERRTVSLVTGGSGFVGNRLARALVERGDQVRALVRDPAGAADLSALGVELVQGDMTDEASLRRAVEGVDRLFHTAGLVGDWLDRRQAVDVNVEGTRRLLAAAVEAGVTRAVHVSSLSVLGTKHHHGTDESGPYVYGDAYTDTKIDSEQVAREFAAGGRIEVVVIRPGFVYGPGDNHVLVPLVERLRSGRFAFIGDGGKEMNTVYIGDVVRAALLADETAAAAGQVYNITDGRNTTIREFVTFITDYLDVPAPTRQVPAAVRQGSRRRHGVGRARRRGEDPAAPEQEQAPVPLLQPALLDREGAARARLRPADLLPRRPPAGARLDPGRGGGPSLEGSDAETTVERAPATPTQLQGS